ncbi:MAG: ChbG/HpnK family deacetylase [Patescibacteria group bacterium]|nr:ChbG/HpnK family deacetylase [Patescibacteria group bacterium]
MKKIIINADDFGMSRIFNNAILELLEMDFIKSTSVLVTRGIENQLDQVEKLKDLKNQKDISIGLHFESDKNDQDYNNLIQNIDNQNDIFIKYLGTKPTHIDKHKQVYSKEEAKAMVDFAVRNNIFIRNSSSGLIQEYKKRVKTSDRIIFLLEESMDDIKSKLLNKVNENEIMEIIAHPRRFDPACKSSLNKDREKDYNNILELVPFLEKNNIAIINQKDI